MSRTPAIFLLPLLVTALTACGGGTGPVTPPSPAPGNAVTTRLAACPVVNTSSDPAASACLAGTYTGVTLNGAACTLTIEASGAYTYTSAALNARVTPTAQSIRVFGHASLSGGHQVQWLISDPMTAAEPHDLSFLARWGSSMPSQTLEIEVTKHLAGGGRTSSTCTMNL